MVEKDWGGEELPRVWEDPGSLPWELHQAGEEMGQGTALGYILRDR